MELTVHGKQMDVGDALKTHMTEKLEDINEKYFGRAIDVVVTISPAPHSFFKTHISMAVGKEIRVQATETAGDPYASFDGSAEKVAKQLRRYKRRLRDHHERLEQLPGDIAPLLIKENIIETLIANDDDEDKQEEAKFPKEPTIVAEMTHKIQKMTVSEAVMRMDLAGESAMMFTNSKTNGLNMVYKRSDGNIGWVDPEASDMVAAE